MNEMADNCNTKNNDSFLLVGSNKKKIMKIFLDKKFNRKKFNKKSGNRNHLIINGKIKVCSISLIIIICIFIIASVIIKFNFKKYIKIRRTNREFEQGSQLNNIISSGEIKLDEKEGEKEKIEKTLLKDISNKSLTFNLTNQIDEEYLFS